MRLQLLAAFFEGSFRPYGRRNGVFRLWVTVVDLLIF